MCQCQLSARDHDDRDQRAPAYLLSAQIHSLVISGRTLFYSLSLFVSLATRTLAKPLQRLRQGPPTRSGPVAQL